ncbi:transmembrane protease serine 3-like protein [Labeo rohita]|uniref:Transmembrane protease serine 3-like protein n=1 Tax=Labeo rohita TaxID=84645 RepID=A0A498NJU6_LABRO|nr:transmembrane protease serine 3-like protein [Labeo rohita]
MASSQTTGETERPVSQGGSRQERDAVEDGTESGALELVSVTEEDLPVVETPTTFNVSSFSSQNSHSSHFYDPDSQDPHVPVELPAVASAPLPVYKVHNIQIPPSPGVPVIKVQPFLNGERLSDLKSLCWPYVSRRLLALLIILGLLIVLILILGIGLGVGLKSCSGKFRCLSSVQCISRNAVCDGVEDCGNGEDELNCGWDSHLGSVACRQLGYNSYVSSTDVPISSIEAVFQNNIVALNINQTGLQDNFKIQNSSYLSFSQPVLWTVYAGITDQPLSGSGALSVEKIIYHANYRPGGQSYNIALIKLKLPLSFSDQVVPICLPSYGKSFEDGQMCLISGWGATVDGGEASVSLHTAQVPLLSSTDCRRQGLTSWNICTGFSEGSAGTCQGDSGGPLAWQGSGWTLVGVASWAESCGQKSKPGIYTSTSEALTWIQQQMEV